MAEFRMPSLGADMEAGTLVECLKRPGDRVKRGDVIAVVETQKGAIEVDIFENGVIERWLVEPGTTVPVGTPLALIGGGPAAERTPEIAPAATVPHRQLPCVRSSKPRWRRRSNQGPGHAARMHRPPRAGWRPKGGSHLIR